ncbi:MAG: Uma2 family endonuclease [Vulcanimicrobiaceae bacterium]
MPLDEIVLPITDPETEWVRGRARAKMSPTRDHARVQLRLGSALDAWAGASGEVGPEWRFRLAPPGEVRRPLVPDLAFVRRERLAAHSDEAIQAPDFAPNLAVEILSPGDDDRDVAEKTRVYLRAGVDVVMVVDPRARTVVAHDAGGDRSFTVADAFEHPALPGFRLELAPFFAAALDRSG